MDNLQVATVVLHGLVAVVIAGFAVNNYTETGDPLSAIPFLVIAALLVGLGWTVGGIVARR